MKSAVPGTPYPACARTLTTSQPSPPPPPPRHSNAESARQLAPRTWMAMMNRTGSQLCAKRRRCPMMSVTRGANQWPARLDMRRCWLADLLLGVIAAGSRRGGKVTENRFRTHALTSSCKVQPENQFSFFLGGILCRRSFYRPGFEWLLQSAMFSSTIAAHLGQLLLAMMVSSCFVGVVSQSYINDKLREEGSCFPAATSTTSYICKGDNVTAIPDNMPPNITQL